MKTLDVFKNALRKVKFIKRHNFENLASKIMYILMAKRWYKRQRKFGKNLDDVYRKKIVQKLTLSGFILKRS